MSSERFSLSYPSRIRFGCGVRRELPELLADVLRGAKPAVFLVTTRQVAGDPKWLKEFRVLCGGSLAGLASGIPHDPSLEAVDRLVELVRGSGANAVVAIGGGSVLDAAKAAAVLVPLNESVRPYYDGKKSLPGPGLPLLALPTTAGTGAEITNNAVLSDVAAGVKKSLRSPFMIAAAALVDPELTFTAPPELVAWSGLDALTQAVESYLSRMANDATRPLAAAATAKLLRHLPAAVCGEAVEMRAARAEVAAGSLLSAMAFSQSSLGAVHGLAHPLGLHLGLAHGLTCAILLPHILRLNAPVCGERLAELAAVALPGQGAGADDFVAAVEALCRILRVPADFAAAGLTPAHFPKILETCRSASMKANPRDLTDAEIQELLHRMMVARA